MLNILNVKYLILMFCIFPATLTFSQIKVEGSIYDEYLEPFYKASVKTEDGSVFKSNSDGIVIISIPKFPQKIIVYYDQFTKDEIILKKGEIKFNVVLKQSLAIDDIVISASRTPERIIESPVDVLMLGDSQIKASVGGSVYKSIGYLTGVQLINDYSGFKSVNTRGFAKFGNNRFVQIVDGMDMAIPASILNQGDFGLPIDIDLKSIEILPGVASALYGANAYNGLMLVTTKSPFDYTGINVKISSGGVSQTKGMSSYEVSVRNAYRFSESFAAKATFSYETGEQWRAEDYRNINSKTGAIDSDLNYQNTAFNGVNIYGDETKTTYQSLLPSKLLTVSRTGFSENQLLGGTFKNKSIKFNSSLNFRPFTNKSLEFILANNISLSDKIIQENFSRYVLNDFSIQKSKVEFKGDNFFVRFNYSSNKTNNAYDLKRLGYELNEKLLNSNLFGQEFSTRVDDHIKFKPLNELDYSKIRELVDSNPKKSTIAREGYSNYIPDINSRLVTQKSGSGIYDNSNYINFEGNYNLSKLLNNYLEFQIGGAYRKYHTESKGTLFNDLEKPIELQEYGFYTQAQKKIFNERLKITCSLRYDENEKFDPQISPRLAFNYMLGENKNHVFRLSFQTGFRNPNIQELYTNRKLGAFAGVIGSAADNNFSLDTAIDPEANGYYNGFKGDLPGSASILKYAILGYKAPKVRLDDILNNSLIGFPYRTNLNDRGTYIKNHDYKQVKPESIRTYELGYRSLFSLNHATNLDFRFSTYYNVHSDFISLVRLTIPIFGDVFPKGERFFSQDEINAISQELEDFTPLTSKLRADGKMQYVLSDMDYIGSLLPGQSKEISMYTNIKSQVTSYGLNVGAKTSLYNNRIDLGVNYSFMDYQFVDKDGGLFDPAFNAPKHTAKTRVGFKRILGNLGTELGVIWSDSYHWSSELGSTDIPERTSIDGELNYVLPSINSTIKLGATNLLNEKYVIAPGAGSIGSTYYLSWIIQN